MFSLRGFLVPLFKVLPVKIWSWNLAHRLRRSKEALGFFLGSGSFLVASEWGFKETLWSLGSERLTWEGKLKNKKSLGSWNFAGSFLDSIQDLEILQRPWPSLKFNFNFSRTSPEITNFLDSPTNDISKNPRKFQWKIKMIKLSFHWNFLNLASEVTKFAHICSNLLKST